VSESADTVNIGAQSSAIWKEYVFPLVAERCPALPLLFKSDLVGRQPPLKNIDRKRLGTALDSDIIKVQFELHP
jgi:hypothetical protein